MHLAPLFRHSLDIARLLADHPPLFRHPHKAAIHRLVAADRDHRGRSLHVSRWTAASLPDRLERSTLAIDLRDDFFAYEPTPQDETCWHLNFAHPDVFAFYDSHLFAQDEIQVLEHPALASVRLFLQRGGMSTMVAEDHPTPILVRDVPRWCRISTRPDAAAGRPMGIYGNHFSKAPLPAVLDAVTPLRPATDSNIIAIAAPANGFGRYSSADIALILLTALAGFAAARTESVDADPRTRVVVHTGLWGCGAFGGNRTLMLLLQMIAAAHARIDCLVIHAPGAAAEFAAARSLLDDLLPAAASTSATTLIERTTALGLEWGVGNGT
jgi:hypothetical protein